MSNREWRRNFGLQSLAKRNQTVVMKETWQAETTTYFCIVCMEFHIVLYNLNIVQIRTVVQIYKVHNLYSHTERCHTIVRNSYMCMVHFVQLYKILLYNRMDRLVGRLSRIEIFQGLEDF